MNILIVDDHAFLRRGLKQLIESEYAGANIFEAKTLQQAIETVRSTGLDVVLLDLALPDAGGLDGLFGLKRIHPDLPILVISMYDDERLAFRALKAGAAGYLTKDRTPEELIEAMQKVSSGVRYLSPNLAVKLATTLIDGKEQLPHERLSQQEYRIMCLIASGKTASEIALRLFLSVKTVSTYRARIFTKMRFLNNADLTRYCIKNNLVD